MIETQVRPVGTIYLLNGNKYTLSEDETDDVLDQMENESAVIRFRHRSSDNRTTYAMTVLKSAFVGINVVVTPESGD
jgi:hypothetical protein